MYKRLSEELRRLQRQLNDLQRSPTHVTIHHEMPKTTTPPKTTPPKSEAADKVRLVSTVAGGGTGKMKENFGKPLIETTITKLGLLHLKCPIISSWTLFWGL